MSQPPISHRWPTALAKQASPRVLLAEDDADLRETVASALRDDGCEVTEAADGGRLLVQLTGPHGRSAEDAYDVLVADVLMPVCSGVEIVEQLRRARWKLPVIFMTGATDDWVRERAARLDALVFAKPFDLDDLRTAVMNFASRPPRVTSP